MMRAREIKEGRKDAEEVRSSVDDAGKEVRLNEGRERTCRLCSQLEAKLSTGVSGVRTPRAQTEGSPGHAPIWLGHAPVWLASWEPSVRVYMLQQ